MFKRIGIVAKPGEVRIRELLKTLIDYLQRRCLDIAIDGNCALLLNDTLLQPLKTPLTGQNCDLIISIGGDGTLLHAAHMIADYKVRLLGINVGHVGFLTDLSPQEFTECLDAILAGHYLEENRMVLTSQVLREGTIIHQNDALNDVVIQKWNIARLITLDTYINDTFVHSQRSDGVIVSTPTGSTAYALSGGGPILHPSLDAVILVPICPHTLSNRPLVVAGNSRIEIMLRTHEIDHARLTCDGEVRCELAPRDRVLVEKAKHSVHLIHPAAHDHFATLRAKLQWG
jgi:NAD+ kinase